MNPTCQIPRRLWASPPDAGNFRGSARIAESKEWYRLALKHSQKNDFRKAHENAQKAVEIWPENHEARKLLDEISSIMIGGRERYGARSIAQQQLSQYRVQVEQAILEITNHIRNGDRLYNARMYLDAITQYENAEFKITAVPLDVPRLKTMLPTVQAMLRRAKGANRLEKRRVEQLKRDQARVEASLHAEAEKREILKKIAHLLELAYLSFDQRRFDACIRICNEILIIDPHYTVAREIIEDAEKVRYRQEYYGFIQKKIARYKELTNSDREAVIPYSKTLTYPSAGKWAEISKRINESVISTGVADIAQDPEVLAINNKLETMKIDMGFEAATLDDIVAFIRDFSGLNIIIDASVRDGGEADLDKEISFKVRDLVLKNVLKLLLPQFGLDYHVTEYRVVMITTPDKAAGNSVLELHDVRDIMVQIQDFPGPKVELVGPDSGGDAVSGAIFDIGGPGETKLGEEEIVELIQENIEPESWDEGDYSITMTPNNQLLVHHTPTTQKKIREFLSRFRSYTGTMVSITARFVSAYDDWMDDFGIDIINRPAAAGFDVPGTGGFGGVGTTIDDAAGEIGPGFVSNESARLESWDLRAQTFHSLLRQDPLTKIGIDPSSGRLVNEGGLGLQYQWLGEQALQLVMRGLHKDSKATLVQAPQITVFNTQRSHIMILSQPLDAQWGE